MPFANFFTFSATFLERIAFFICPLHNLLMIYKKISDKDLELATAKKANPLLHISTLSPPLVFPRYLAGATTKSRKTLHS